MHILPSRFFAYGLFLSLVAFFLYSELTHAATLQLNWADNSNNEGGFFIERRDGIGGSFTPISSVGADITSYTDINLANDTEYCYRVSAFNYAGASQYSNEACARTSGSFSTNIDIKANGLDGPLEIRPGQNVSVTISLQPGDKNGLQADWWLADSTLFGLYWYVGNKGWVRSDYPLPYYDGSLFELSPIEVLNSTGLAAGTYTFFFAVDLRRNGSFDSDQMYFDTVTVEVK